MVGKGFLFIARISITLFKTGHKRKSIITLLLYIMSHGHLAVPGLPEPIPLPDQAPDCLLDVIKDPEILSRGPQILPGLGSGQTELAKG